MTVSPLAGTCAGDQFAAVFQLPPAVLVQISVVARLNGATSVIIPAVRRNKPADFIKRVFMGLLGLEELKMQFVIGLPLTHIHDE